MRPLLAGTCLLLLAACGGRSHVSSRPGAAGGLQLAGSQPRAPDFATRPYAPLSREAVIAIALREWRAWGMHVADEPPGAFVLATEQRPDRQTGMWQRVGEYWWLGQDASRTASYWTGLHDEWGNPFPDNGAHPWSAAFISYVMRTAGDVTFPTSPLHADYINAAARGQGGLTAEPPDTTPPGPGDLICTGRGAAQAMQFRNLPTGAFSSHCDIVVAASPGQLQVIGGNVQGSVSLKHVPVTDTGTLAPPGGRPVDDRYDWFVVLRPNYPASLS